MTSNGMEENGTQMKTNKEGNTMGLGDDAWGEK